jgi:hypothetical protein
MRSSTENSPGFDPTRHKRSECCASDPPDSQDLLLDNCTDTPHLLGQRQHTLLVR